MKLRGAITEAALSSLAVTAFDIGVRRFVVAGGETSGAVAQALDVAQLRVGREIAPGVPWTFASRQHVPIALTLKSGNFGSELFFSEALAVLDDAA